MTEIIISSAVCLVAGSILGYVFFRYVLKKTYKKSIQDANKEAEVIKEKKLLEVKEKFLNKKAELEKEVQQRNQKIAQAENKLKQREISLNQRQDELNRRKQEVENNQTKVNTQLQLIQKKEEELEKMQLQEREKLEELSGLTAEEAKERLIESMKDEARTNAQAYINEIVDDAKMTASKEAKKIVIQTIQRTATETAIEIEDFQEIEVCGLKMISDEEFFTYCAEKDSAYVDYIYGEIGVAKYNRGKTEEAVEFVFANTSENAFPRNNARN